MTSALCPLRPGGGGDSCGNERGFDQSFATAVRAKYPGFALHVPGIYAKRTVNEKIAGCGRKQLLFYQGPYIATNEQSPQRGAFSGDLLDLKSKSPLFPGPGGPWLQMTSALEHLFFFGGGGGRGGGSMV